MKYERICDKKTSKFPNGRRGTEAGESAHRQAKEKPCKECYEARARKSRERKRKKNPPIEQPEVMTMACEERSRRFPEGKTGTNSGYLAHRKAGEEACDACREGMRSASRESWSKLSERYREKKNEYQREYRKMNPERISAHTRARELKKQMTYDGYTKEELLDRDGPLCYLCQGEVDLEVPRGGPRSVVVEHLIPLMQEGSPGDVRENVKLAHARCNLVKGKRRPEDLELPLEFPGEEW